MKILEKIFSIKNKDCHKIITICGLKIKFKNKFKILEHKITYLEKEKAVLAEKNSEFQRELESIQESLEAVNYKQDSLKSQIVIVDKKYDTKATAFIQKLRENNYEQLLADYKYNGFSQELLTEFKNLERSKFCWQVENNNLWLLYLLVLLENNILDDVDTIIKKYLHFHQLKDVENFPIVANYFHNLEYTNERIEKSSIIYKKFLEAQQNKTFENLIKGKTIAVVGNGPSEIGKGKGAEIDSHDIVVRFNKFPIEGYETDYGKKTNVWVNCAVNKEFLNYDKNFDYEMILWLFDCFYFRNTIAIDNLIDRFQDNWGVFGVDISKSIWNNHQFYHAPTTGFHFIIYLFETLKTFENVKFYGFKFCEDNNLTDMHYFDKESFQAHKWHNFDDESKFLSEFIIKNKGGINA